MKAKRGYFLIDAMFSVALIVIISVYIIPALMNSIFTMKRTAENHENIKKAQNKMEELIGENYCRKEFKLPKDSDSTMYSARDIGGGLVEVSVRCREKDNEAEFKIIVRKKGLYAD